MSTDELLDTSSLSELAFTINQEHELAYRSALDALDHAIMCGESLIEARTLVPEGSWRKWMADNLEMGSSSADQYMRIATYRDQVLSAEHRPRSINGAITYLREIEAPRRPMGHTGRHPTFSVDEAKRLKELGMTNKDIGKALGVSDVAVWRQLTPGATRRAVVLNARARTKERADKRTAAQREQDEKMTEIGGEPAEAYRLLHQCAAVLDQAIAAGDAQHDLRKALTHVHRAEDAVVRSVGLQPRRRH